MSIATEISATTWALLAGAIFILAHLRVRYQKGLGKFKGPALASCTNLWRLWQVYWYRENPPFMLWREKYGETFRLGPNLIVFTDPACVKEIYSSGYDKSDQYMVSAGVSKGKVVANIFSTDDKKWHSQLRRSINNAFALSTLIQYEALVDQTLAGFLSKMESLFADEFHKKPVDLALWFRYFAFDVIGRLSYSSSYGLIESEGRGNGMIDTIQDFFRYISVVTCWPILDQLLKKNPFILWLGRQGIYDKTTPTVPFAREQLAIRKQKHQDAEHFEQDDQADNQRGSDFLEKFLKAKELHPEVIDDNTVLGLTLSAVNAGSDTVATAITVILYYLVKHPEALKKVMEELDAKHPPLPKSTALGDGIVSFKDGKSLPYLNACIQEALRLHPPAGGALFERVVPAQGATICGHFVPGGTKVSTLAYLMHRHKPTFGEDADEYRPERWLDNGVEGDDLRLANMNRALFIFGVGPHTCLGKNIGLLELHKTVPTMLRCFEISLDDPSSGLKIVNDVVMGIKDLNVTLKRRYV